MYPEYDLSDLSRPQSMTLRRIGALSHGFRVKVPVGLNNIPYNVCEQLQDLGLVVIEWGQHDGVGESQSMFNGMGWNVRLTDGGINTLRASLAYADDEFPMEGDPTSGEEWIIPDEDVPMNEDIQMTILRRAGLLKG